MAPITRRDFARQAAVSAITSPILMNQDGDQSRLSGPISPGGFNKIFQDYRGARRGFAKALTNTQDETRFDLLKSALEGLGDIHALYDKEAISRLADEDLHAIAGMSTSPDPRVTTLVEKERNPKTEKLTQALRKPVSELFQAMTKYLNDVVEINANIAA